MSVGNDAREVIVEVNDSVAIMRIRPERDSLSIALSALIKRAPD
jgi:hypothetical protein